MFDYCQYWPGNGLVSFFGADLGALLPANNVGLNPLVALLCSFYSDSDSYCSDILPPVGFTCEVELDIKRRD